MIGVIIWIFFSFMVAFAGQGKKVGYWGTWAIALLLSPVVGLIVGLISGEEKKIFIYTCKHCKYASKENSYYCPRCQKDPEGLTADQNKEKFS